MSTLPRFKEIRDKYPLATKNTRNDNNIDLLLKSEKSAIYSFSKLKKSPSFAATSNVNENRFDYNPRDQYPGAYESTHRK